MLVEGSIRRARTDWPSGGIARGNSHPHYFTYDGPQQRGGDPKVSPMPGRVPANQRLGRQDSCISLVAEQIHQRRRQGKSSTASAWRNCMEASRWQIPRAGRRRCSLRSGPCGSLTFGLTSSRRWAWRRSCVPSSSAPIKREQPATSAARIAVKRRTEAMSCPAERCRCLVYRKNRRCPLWRVCQPPHFLKELGAS